MNNTRSTYLGIAAFFAAISAPLVVAAHGPASPHTAAANQAVYEELDFSDRQSFEDVTRGFIGAIEPPVIRDAEGTVVWELESYDFLAEDAPDTANPSLWRQAQLNAVHGLYEITDGVYQLRGYDVSNMVVIRGETGWIVVDPMLTQDTARAGLDLVFRELGEAPVTTVIYTHSHADHFGGARGVVDMEAYENGDVQIIAPEGFVEHAIFENVIAGNAMTRRSTYMYGNVVPRGPDGQIGAGLGKTTSTGIASVVEPTTYISETGTVMMVDGVEMEFIMASGSEAPAEFMFYLPGKDALCTAEVTSQTMHNVYSLRGVNMRDALGWSKYINEVLHKYGSKVDVVFGTHHWPVFGEDRIETYLKSQRDTYRFIHDETMRLANNGYGPREISEMIELPEALAKTFSSRGYYGSLKHNAAAVYNYYFGWFNGNPAILDRHIPSESGRRYVDAIGGADRVLEVAQTAYDAGDYRWAAELLNHLVLSQPKNKAAKNLQAETLTQLGYQAESASWRNFYLAAAKELRDGIKPVASPRRGDDLVSHMTLELFFDLLAVMLNPQKAEGESITINFEFPDTGEVYLLELENSVLNNTKGARAEDADVSMVMDRATLNKLLLRQAGFARLAITGQISFEGNPLAFRRLMKMMDEFDPWFPLGTARDQG